MKLHNIDERKGRQRMNLRIQRQESWRGGVIFLMEGLRQIERLPVSQRVPESGFGEMESLKWIAHSSHSKCAFLSSIWCRLAQLVALTMGF